ncbi:dynein light chain Tctex-type 5-B [Patella vulgata]|uniref:dynein light chain Tctex-type 5-B n=1 Tax=Patella vulgata TaxID=6465 RepID=UPI00217F48E5|nr:dynein light chain Tctex-type 5-B [Patella vulgata]
MTDNFLGAKGSSVFDLTARKAAPCGSSTMSFAYEPHQEDHRQPKRVYYENTFRMEPPEKFRPDKVLPIIERVLTKHLEGVKYSSGECSSISKTIADEIKSAVKDLNFERYKIISQVTIGEKKDQGVRVGSRFLWDADRDNYASFSFENRSIFATGIVFAVYYE